MPISAPNSVSPVARSHAAPLGGAALRAASPAEQRTAVGAQFEAILVRQLLGPTLTNLFGSDSGAAGSVYGDMLTDVMASKLCAGRGLGLGRLIEQQLTPRALPAVQPGSPVAALSPAAASVSLPPSP